MGDGHRPGLHRRVTPQQYSVRMSRIHESIIAAIRERADVDDDWVGEAHPVGPSGAEGAFLYVSFGPPSGLLLVGGPCWVVAVPSGPIYEVAGSRPPDENMAGILAGEIGPEPELLNLADPLIVRTGSP